MGLLRKFKKNRDETSSLTPDGMGAIKPESAKKFTINKTSFAFVLAIALGILGVITANSWIEDRITAMEDEFRSKDKMVNVVVPKRDIAKGERVYAADLSVRKMPLAYVDRGTVTPDRFEIAVGQTLTHDVQQGRPVLWAHLRGGQVPTFSGMLPDGMRALTILVGETNTISGMLQPQDRVDIFMTLSTNNRNSTMPLLQNVLVLATGTFVRSITQEDSQMNNRRFSTITVLVKPDKAKMIVLAQKEGSISVVLRHPEDQKPGPETRITKATLLREGRSKRTWVSIITGDT